MKWLKHILGRPRARREGWLIVRREIWLDPLIEYAQARRKLYKMREYGCLIVRDEKTAWEAAMDDLWENGW